MYRVASGGDIPRYPKMLLGRKGEKKKATSKLRENVPSREPSPGEESETRAQAQTALVPTQCDLTSLVSSIWDVCVYQTEHPAHLLRSGKGCGTLGKQGDEPQEFRRAGGVHPHAAQV